MAEHSAVVIGTGVLAVASAGLTLLTAHDLSPLVSLAFILLLVVGFGLIVWGAISSSRGYPSMPSIPTIIRPARIEIPRIEIPLNTATRTFIAESVFGDRVVSEHINFTGPGDVHVDLVISDALISHAHVERLLRVYQAHFHNANGAPAVDVQIRSDNDFVRRSIPRGLGS